MNDLQIFQNDEFGEIRTVMIDNEPWFVAADVCRILELTNPTVSLERLDVDEKAKLNLGLKGGDTNCVNEYGLYTLVLGSRKPEAKAFKRWITHDVIPQIRKTGSYSLNRANLSPELKMFYAIADSQARVEIEQQRQAAEIKRLDDKFSNMQEILTAPIGDWKTEINDRVREIAIKSNIDFQILWGMLYGELENTAHCCLKTLQKNKKERMEQTGITKTAIKESTTKLAVIADKPKLKAIFEGIVRNYAVRYCS